MKKIIVLIITILQLAQGIYLSPTEKLNQKSLSVIRQIDAYKQKLNENKFSREEADGMLEFVKTVIKNNTSL